LGRCKSAVTTAHQQTCSLQLGNRIFSVNVALTTLAAAQRFWEKILNILITY